MNKTLVKSSFLISLVLLSSGCDFRRRSTQGAVAGGAVGAGAGAAIGHQSGNAGGGAAVGAVSGAVVGGTLGAASEEAEANERKRDEMLRFQEKERERQQREIEDIKRQQFHDQEFKRKYGVQDSED